MTVDTWKDLVSKARQVRDESMHAVDKWFPAESNHWGELPSPLPLNVRGIPKTLLNAVDYEIVETAPLELVQQMAQKKYSAMQVAGAYLRAAVISQRLVNCVTEFLPEEAYHQAKYLDEYLETHGEIAGPLHGIPISVKELIGFKNHSQTKSITAFVENIADDDALTIKMLRELGANFHIRTTEPQTYMCIESHSQLYGTTTNPYNTNLTPGGSSSGEAASLALHSSSIGIGTDIGGSIRWPAAIVGAYGFKPTAFRLSQLGCLAFMNGCRSIPAAIGPMTRDVESAVTFTRELIQAKPWQRDPVLNGLRWNDEPLKGQSTVRIGVMRTDGVVTPHPPILRAIDTVVGKLQQAGSIDGYKIELVPFEPYKHKEAWSLLMGLYYEDGGEDIKHGLAQTGEPALPLTEWIMSQPETKRLDIRELWERNKNKDGYALEYLHHWNSYNIDALICPAGPGAATPHGNSKYWAYTAHWNLLDYPGAVFPVTHVDQELDKAKDGYTPLNEKDEFNHQLYDPEVYRDAPVSLQLIGQRSEDERVLRVLQLIDSVL